MIRNNILSTIFQLMVSVLVLGFVLWAYHTNLEGVLYGQLVYRSIFIFIICCLYFLLGKLLKKSIHPVKMVASFLLPIGLGAFFVLVGHLFVEETVLVSGVGDHLSLLPLDLFLLPQRMIFTLLKLPQNSTTLMVEIILPSIFMFISLLEGNIRLIGRKRKRNKS